VNANDNDLACTPLDEASYHGYVQVFNELLEHGSDIEANDNHDSTPLHNAAMEGHLAVFIEL
jgi:ankyrin repeat protein